MFQAIYEVRLAGHDFEIDYETWDIVREHAREHKFFFVVHDDMKYKYTHAQTFLDRPTRFDFEIANPEDEIVEYIYIK